MTMSQLNPAVIKSSDIVYVGYLSGLGMLADYVFAGSRLSVGESFDELVDRNTKQRYISQAQGASIRGERKFHDYGYFATFSGPSGNRIVVIAGTRDVAAMHMAETLDVARRTPGAHRCRPARCRASRRCTRCTAWTNSISTASCC